MTNRITDRRMAGDVSHRAHRLCSDAGTPRCAPQLFPTLPHAASDPRPRSEARRRAEAVRSTEPIRGNECRILHAPDDERGTIRDLLCLAPQSVVVTVGAEQRLCKPVEN